MRRLFPLLPLVLLASRAVAAEKTDEWVRFGRGRAAQLEKEGRYEEAVEELISLAALTPKDPQPLIRGAVLAVETPVWRGGELMPSTLHFGIAQRCVREAILRWGQGDPALSYAIGRLHWAEGRWGAAWKTLGDAMRRGFDPVRSRFWYYRAAVNRSNMLIDTNRSSEALEELKSLLVAQPGHPDEHTLTINLAQAHRGVQEHDEAMRVLDAEIAKNPGAADTYYVRGQLLADEGRLEEAEDSFRKTMIRLSASFGERLYRDALLRLSETEVKLNKLDDAEIAVNSYLSLAKDDGDGLFQLGRVKHARGQLEEALKLFRRAVRLLPKAYDTLVELKKVLYQLGMTQEAEEVGKRIEEVQQRVNDELMGISPPAPSAPKPR